MIQIESLTRVYGSRSRTVHALRDVSLSIGSGVWAVVGPNGAGKTTLLGLVLGLLRPTSGTVRIHGDRPQRFVRRRGAAYLPERFRLPPEWPVRSALTALARLEGLGAAEARRRADVAMGRVGLDGLADRPAGTLSRGLNQRLGLAQTLLAERDLVVLDEPADGLDPLWRVRLRELVAGLATGGRTVLLASHELAEVERVANRVVILDDGRVKDVMDAREKAAAVRYRIDADAPADAWAAAFPDAEGDVGPRLVTVADERELSHRLAGLLDAGGVVRAVTPVTEPLEDRVRRRLEDA